MEEELATELATKGYLSDTEEDIHSVVESRLQKYAGESAMRLHTGRSRNDQSATDMRLWMLSSLPKIYSVLIELITVCANLMIECVSLNV